MYIVAINHAVADFEKWKQVYDTYPPTTAGGAKFSRVNRGIDDPDVVTVVAGFDSLDTLKTFASNPQLKDAMHQAGVLGQPRIEMYEEVEVV